MTEHGDRLREAFTKHEKETPDPAAVYARVEELAQKYKWRRRGAQAAGGVALSAGLIAGITQLPGILPHDPAATPAFQVAAPASTPTAPPTLDPSAPLTEDEVKEGLQAYFEAGFGYDNAVELAGLWKLGTDRIAQVKAVAGQKLLSGETLPVKPEQNPDTPASEEPVDEEAVKQLDKFFLAGYGWDEAVKLARLWKMDDPSDAKVEAGKRLLAGEKLPIKPDPKRLEEAKEARLANIFWDAGYDSEDATKLAKLWKMDDTYDAKVEAGRRLNAGETLPIQP
ncbi:hypothetical protein AB0G04_05060 [Actinoplanes sp. NPDC023801]|uniref:hypothetical protein n=1 Tax=Actinoplanes sp. NPDC023801 TaxID=3154595 RepID=UPI0033C0FCA0